MGLQSCKARNFCLQSGEECGAAAGCCCVRTDWRYCPDRCCDICCQMCVDVCTGLCSEDCSYTFCTLCLSLVRSCISLFTSTQPDTRAHSKSVTGERRLLPLYGCFHFSDRTRAAENTFNSTSSSLTKLIFRAAGGAGGKFQQFAHSITGPNIETDTDM